MSAKKYLRQHAYRWHRITSLIIALPVLLWTISGFLHPVFNARKPVVMNQSLPPRLLDSDKIRLSIREALERNGIASIQRFRIVDLYGASYYQIKLKGSDTLSYISCYNAQWLPSGDQQYAGWMAQRYLSDEAGNKGQGDHHGGAAANIIELPVSGHRHTDKPNISNISFQEHFDQDYKKSNKILPVYKVSFYREDGIRIYMDTETDRMVTAVDNRKAFFNRFFSITHSWSFLEGLGIWKHLLIGLVSLLCLLSSFFGYYVYNLTGTKKINREGQRTKKIHRSLGNVFMLTTLLYAFSGGWHALQKINREETTKPPRIQQELMTGELSADPIALSGLLGRKDSLYDVSAVKMNGRLFWQLFSFSGKKKTKHYFDQQNREWENGDKQYARFVADLLSKKTEAVVATEKIFRYSNRYSMMQKRLPVVEVNYEDGEACYIETSTGILAARVSAADRAERFSFSNLHMHHYWEDLGGKAFGRPMRNAMLLGTTFGLMLLAMTGCFLYYKKKKKLGHTSRH